MSDAATNYQCPNCMGPLHFSSETGKLECEYCGSNFTPDELEAINQEAIASEAHPEEVLQEEISGSWGEAEDKMRAYSCPSCGAQLICDETTAATSCPYCNNPTIIPGQFHGTLCPEYIIPFKLNQKDAEAALRQHYRKKLLLPRVFAAENHIREVKGVYVPFWMFDETIDANITYNAVKVRTRREGDYRVTNTSHYTVRRTGQMTFQKVPVDASQKMADDLMDSLEPYNYQDLTAFTTAYLPGYLANKYDVSSQDAAARANNRCRLTTETKFRNSVSGYDAVSIREKELNPASVSSHYAMLPVWILNTQWKGKNYVFAMNGQTGKIVGDLPIDTTRKRLLFLGTFLGLTAILSLFLSGPIGAFLNFLLGNLFF